MGVLRKRDRVANASIKKKTRWQMYHVCSKKKRCGGKCVYKEKDKVADVCSKKKRYGGKCVYKEKDKVADVSLKHKHPKKIDKS